MKHLLIIFVISPVFVFTQSTQTASEFYEEYRDGVKHYRQALTHTHELTNHFHKSIEHKHESERVLCITEYEQNNELRLIEVNDERDCQVYVYCEDGYLVGSFDSGTTEVFSEETCEVLVYCGNGNILGKYKVQDEHPLYNCNLSQTPPPNLSANKPENKRTIKIYPNPSPLGQDVNVTITSGTNDSSVSIYILDNFGQKVLEDVVSIYEGINKISLNINRDVPDTIYKVMVRFSDGTWLAQSVVIVHN